MPISPVIPPSLIYFAGALLVLILPGVLRKIGALLTAAIGFGYFFLIYPLSGGEDPATLWTLQLLDFELTFGLLDEWRMIFYNIFSLLGFIGIIFILHTKGALEYSAGLLYTGAAVGVILAGDLISLFVFWELLTVGAVLLILARKSERSTQAAFRYVTIHVLGGVILLAGIVLHIHEAGNTAIAAIELGSIASWFIFIGIGINCAWPILGAWLPDTYPEASPGGLVFMATFTTKSAIFVLAQLFAGESYLIWIGCVMAILPLLYAAIENDLRRVLAYCLVNQVGFMVISVGLGSAIALNGTAGHAYCHILYKSLLFMAAGAVLYRTGKSKATELGGLYKHMPLTCLFGCIGAASISFPFLCGFVSKSMIMSAAAKSEPLVWLILLFGSAGVFLLAGLKFPFYTFFSKDSGLRPKEAPLNMLIAMGITAAICIFTGSFNNVFLYKMLPMGDLGYDPYSSVPYVVDQFALIAFTALSFALLILSGLLPAELRASNLDASLLYRKGGKIGYWISDKSLNAINAGAHRSFIGKFIPSISRLFADFPARAAGAFMTPIWVLTGTKAADLSGKRRDMRNAVRSGAARIGATACLAVVLLAVLFLIRI
ncbi:MAG: Na(+)/H(+) antiporter subunit D [Verrucomicrobiota bacterium]